MKKIVVVYSGGLDSTVLLFHAVNLHGAKNVQAVTFDYGSKHNEKEIACAKWNAKNTMEELRGLDNCEYVFGWLENQPYHIQSSVSSVPVVVVYKDNIPKQQYTADITLRLSATFEEIQTLVNSLKEQ